MARPQLSCCLRSTGHGVDPDRVEEIESSVGTALRQPRRGRYTVPSTTALSAIRFPGHGTPGAGRRRGSRARSRQRKAWRSHIHRARIGVAEWHDGGRFKRGYKGLGEIGRLLKPPKSYRQTVRVHEQVCP